MITTAALFRYGVHAGLVAAGSSVAREDGADASVLQEDGGAPVAMPANPGRFQFSVAMRCAP